MFGQGIDHRQSGSIALLLVEFCCEDKLHPTIKCVDYVLRRKLKIKFNIIVDRISVVIRT